MIPLDQAPPRQPANVARGPRIATFLARVSMVVGVLLALLVGYVGVVAATGNFHSVVAGEVYRSAQPSGATLSRYQRDYGIRTVINLRGENASEAWYQDEIATSRRLGIRHIM